MTDLNSACARGLFARLAAQVCRGLLALCACAYRATFILHRRPLGLRFSPGNDCPRLHRLFGCIKISRDLTRPPAHEKATRVVFPKRIAAALLLASIGGVAQAQFLYCSGPFTYQIRMPTPEAALQADWYEFIGKYPAPTRGPQIDAARDVPSRLLATPPRQYTWGVGYYTETLYYSYGNEGNIDGQSWRPSPEVQCPHYANVTIEGASQVRTAPAEKSIKQTVKLAFPSGAPVHNTEIEVRSSSGARTTGVTNDQGEFSFYYRPPQFATRTKLTVTCFYCKATDKQISVVAPPEQTCPVGNPILPATAEKIKAETDWTDEAPHSLTLTRHYSSAGELPVAGLGPNWAHGHSGVIDRSENGQERTVKLGDRSRHLFMLEVPTGTWRSDNAIDSLADNTTGPLFVRGSDESRWQFDLAGKLLSVTERNGWTRRFAYAGSLLTSVTNAFGRSLRFNYDEQGRLNSVLTPDAQQISYAVNSAGALASVARADGAVRRYVYEDSRWPFAMTGVFDELGQRFETYSYDAYGRATSTTRANGADSFQVAYGAITGTGDGFAAELNGESLPSRVQVTDPLGVQRTHNYQGGDGNLRLQGTTVPLDGSQIASRSFGQGVLPISETDFLGITTLFTWDAARRLKLAETRAASRPEAQTVQTQWHPTLRLPVLVTEAGRTTAYSYDALGNKLTEVVTDLATGQTRGQSGAYNAQGLPAQMTDARGGQWAYSYDAQGNRTTERNPLGHETRWQYDGAGRVTRQTEANGLVSSYSYDPRGRLTQASRGGEATTYSYTPTGLLASASLPSGHAINYQYDAAQRLTGASDNRGNSVAYTLDGMGNRVREEVKDAGGAIALVTARVINSLNKVAAVQGASGQTTALGYDANGEPISQTDPLNQTTRQTLDGLKRPSATTFADNAAATQAWNQLDQLTQVTDPKGVATQYVRNAFGEVLSEASPDTGTTSYQRDAAGAVVAMTDARGITTQISRDALGRPVQTTRGPAHQTVYTWDTQQKGYLAKVEDPSGATTWERDAQGRTLRKTQLVNDNPANPASFSTAYSYSAGGELAAITYPSGLKVSYQRNAAGQISAISTQVPGRNKPVTPFVSNLTHTALGQPKAWNWVNGAAASRSFDADGRMTDTEFASYSYDDASRIASITQNLWASRTVTQTVGTTTATVTQLYQTPLRWFAGYDNRNRLTSFERAGAQTSYTYDANSNRLSAIDASTSDTDLDGQFEQSDFNQSTRQALNIASDSNRLLGFSQNLTRMRGDRTISSATSNVNYTLDAAGNLTSDGLRTFDYDEANRISKARIFKDGEAARISYLHNAQGQRVFKGEPSTEQTLPSQAELGQGFIDWLKANFKWMFAQAQANTSIGTAYTFGGGPIPSWAILGEYDNGAAKGAGRSEYIWLPTPGGAIPVGMFRNGNFFAIHTDHLGTPRLMTNEDNQPVWQWPYSAFGTTKPTGVLKATANPRTAVVVIDNTPLPPQGREKQRAQAAAPMNSNIVLLKATAAPEMNLRFPGQYEDAEMGTFYNYFRSYQPNQGRYTQGDPIGLEGGLNRFSYVEGNPASRVDPLGLEWTYQQSTGNMYSGGNNPSATVLVGTGYAGHGVGVNNSALEGIPDIGPLPQGTYTIGDQQTIVTRDRNGNPRATLDGAMRLIPDPENWMFGRSGFIIHNGNMRTRTSSEGCIIQQPSVRNLIGASGDRRLRVVP